MFLSNSLLLGGLADQDIRCQQARDACITNATSQGVSLDVTRLWLHRDGDKVMLMRKVGKHGPGKWGLPGGSADSKDADDLATAEREAKEEVGGVPAHEVKGQIQIRRCAPHWSRKT
jgi:8-oxo-dGTP pyrophosphatase MutT (NUDIX family)